MKKKVLILSFFLALISTSNAQIGINTDKPQGVFHFDGKGDTDSSDLTTDDIIVTTDGKVGIGTTTPTETLDVEGSAKNKGNLTSMNVDVNGVSAIREATSIGGTSSTASLTTPAIKIDDNVFTSADAGRKFLISDENGNASWEYPRPDSYVVNYDMTTGKPTPLYDDIKVRDGGLVGVELTKPSSTAKNSEQWVDITTAANRLVLTKGRWLILCKFEVTVRDQDANINWNDPLLTAGAEMLLWASLRATSATRGDYETVRYGFKPEQSGYMVVTPHFTYLADVEEETTFYVTSALFYDTTTRFRLSNSGFGGSYFTAIRLLDNR